MTNCPMPPRQTDMNPEILKLCGNTDDYVEACAASEMMSDISWLNKQIATGCLAEGYRQNILSALRTRNHDVWGRYALAI